MPAIRPIENVRRRLASTSSGPDTLGRSSERRIRNRDSPSDSAAATKSRSTTDTAAPRTTRAMRGTVEIPTVRMMSVVEAPNMEMTINAEMICGRARITSIDLISTSSSLPRL